MCFCSYLSVCSWCQSNPCVSPEGISQDKGILVVVICISQKEVIKVQHLIWTIRCSADAIASGMEEPTRKSMHNSKLKTKSCAPMLRPDHMNSSLCTASVALSPRWPALPASATNDSYNLSSSASLGPQILLDTLRIPSSSLDTFPGLLQSLPARE